MSSGVGSHKAVPVLDSDSLPPPLDDPLEPPELELSSRPPLEDDDVLDSPAPELEPPLVDPAGAPDVDPEPLEVVPEPSSVASEVSVHPTIAAEGRSAAAFAAFTTNARRVQTMPITVA